jgi:hypothetical protein
MFNGAFAVLTQKNWHIASQILWLMIRDLKVSPSFPLLDSFFQIGYSENNGELDVEDVAIELDSSLKNKMQNKGNRRAKCDFLLRQLESINVKYKYGGGGVNSKK